MKKLINIIDKVEKATNCCIIAETEPKLTTKSRSTKEPLPAKFHGLKKLTRAVLTIAVDYKTLVENRLKKAEKEQGIELNKDFNPDETYTEKLTVNGVILKHKDNGKLFFRGYQGLTSKIYESIYVNPKGEKVEVTDQEYEDYFPKSYGSVKQMTAGVQQEIKPLNYSLENIKYFQCGKLIYNDLDDKIMNLLDLQKVE